MDINTLSNKVYHFSQDNHDDLKFFYNNKCNLYIIIDQLTSQLDIIGENDLKQVLAITKRIIDIENELVRYNDYLSRISQETNRWTELRSKITQFTRSLRAYTGLFLISLADIEIPNELNDYILKKISN
jgi:hypothetical protein